MKYILPRRISKLIKKFDACVNLHLWSPDTDVWKVCTLFLSCPRVSWQLKNKIQSRYIPAEQVADRHDLEPLGYDAIPPNDIYIVRGRPISQLSVVAARAAQVQTCLHQERRILEFESWRCHQNASDQRARSHSINLAVSSSHTDRCTIWLNVSVSDEWPLLQGTDIGIFTPFLLVALPRKCTNCSNSYNVEV